MRTKTALLCAAAVAAGAMSAMAQNVYSLNVVGYINLTVQTNTAPLTQFAFISNPLTNDTDMSVSNILVSVPTGTKAYVWDYTIPGYGIYTKRAAGNWTGGSAGLNGLLNPGVSFFLQNNTTSNITATLVGNVPQGTNSASYGQGFNFITTPFPISGLVQTTLGAPATNLDKVYQWAQSTQTYTITTRRAGTSWTGGLGLGEPSLAVAEGMIFFGGANSPVSGTWTRSFTVQ